MYGFSGAEYGLYVRNGHWHYHVVAHVGVNITVTVIVIVIVVVWDRVWVIRLNWVHWV